MKKIQILKLFIFILLFSFARIVSAQGVFNEIQISPIGERFIELYNNGGSDVDLTGWYIQRKTATGSSFSSLVTSTQLNGKTIKGNGYFLISRGQLENSDIVIDNLTLTESNTIRIRDSKGEDIDQITWTAIPDGKSYQRVSANEWVIATPTPGRSSSNTSGQSIPPTSLSPSPSSSSLTLSSFPVEPQIIVSAGATTRASLAGAPIIFSGKVFGLKKEPIENARMVWSFGDGGRGEGASATHIYYYPGEYIVALEASSGFYSASARIRVVVGTPQLMLHTGGDNIHSFISIENQANSEVDLSGWKISAQNKDFIFPQNTILGAHKTVSFASEVTGLITPLGVSASLHFPNGTLINLYSEKILSSAEIPVSSEKSSGKIISKQSISPSSQLRGLQTREQTASVLNTLSDPFIHSDTLASKKRGRGWLWYSGAGALGIFAFLGFRLSRRAQKTDDIDEYEIIEDEISEKEENKTVSPLNKFPF